MPTSLVTSNSLLAIDVGAANTRAVLFDVIEGEYRFVASGVAPSTAEAPVKDVSEGARNAIEALQNILKKPLLETSARSLIMPSQPDGSGVDSLVVTISAGPSIRALVVGLLKDVSFDSARRLTESTYARIMDTLHLGDQRKPEQQIDSILRIRPDMVIIAGGTDGGASRSVQKLLEPIGLASYLMPEEKRPAVLYAGNDKLADEIKTLVGSLASTLHFSPNIRPSLETEDIDPAELELAQMTMTIRKKQLKGLDVLDLWAGGHTLPTAYATGRMVRFLSKVYGSPKGLLSVDLGSSSAVIAAGFQNKSVLKTFPHFGLGENITSLLNYTTIDDILRWSSLDIPPSVIQNYLYQKALYPSAISATKEDFAISQAVAKQALFLAMQAALHDFPKDAASIKPNLAPLFDPIIAGGSALSDASRPGQSLLLLLDSVQPVGISTVILDQNNLMPMLGAAASQNNILPVQVLESGAFLSVGTVISPVVSARYGQTILKAKVVYESGTEAKVDLKYGFLETLPLASGETGKITIQVSRGVDIGFGPGRGVKGLTITGGALGVVFDGRGRPLDLPSDPVRRRELIKKWNWTLGGG
ncbi:MAG: glutamate mutase L [Anaerolineales bacterium]|nr:glutamate mutase L [Anaerolineales bacterium]MCB9111929.1 glutamate mutase L [Anaerolineales bacterium]